MPNGLIKGPEMNTTIERRVHMPSGRRESDYYNAEWCKERHDRIDKRLDEVTGPDGHLNQVHKRINGILWAVISVGIIGVANLIATAIY